MIDSSLIKSTERLRKTIDKMRDLEFFFWSMRDLELNDISLNLARHQESKWAFLTVRKTIAEAFLIGL